MCRWCKSEWASGWTDLWVRGTGRERDNWLGMKMGERVEDKWRGMHWVVWIEWEGRWVVDGRMGKNTNGGLDG